MNKEHPARGVLVLQPLTVNLEDLETHVLAHSSERENSDSEGEASKVETKMEAQYLYSLHQRPKQSIPRAEKLEFLITAEHRVLNEGCESRNNHKFTVVVQDLATQ